jgi:hypothetical protein
VGELRHRQPIARHGHRGRRAAHLLPQPGQVRSSGSTNRRTGALLLVWLITLAPGIGACRPVALGGAEQPSAWPRTRRILRHLLHSYEREARLNGDEAERRRRGLDEQAGQGRHVPGLLPLEHHVEGRGHGVGGCSRSSGPGRRPAGTAPGGCAGRRTPVSRPVGRPRA